MQLNNEQNMIFSRRPTRISPEYNASTNQENLLKQENQKLKAKIKQRDRLIQVMAHDLKAPLSSFLSFVTGSDRVNPLIQHRKCFNYDCFLP